MDTVPFMDSAVQNVAISGPTLAIIMQDFGSSQGDCDGVLFGHMETTMASSLQDDDEQPGLREELTAVVTGFYCSGRLLSFYDAAGGVDYAKLAQLTGYRENRGGDSPIGWFVGRRNSPMRPSMREAAVTHNLRLGSSSYPRNGGISRGKASAGSSGGLPIARESRMPARAGGIGDRGNQTELGGSPLASRASSQSSGNSRDGSGNPQNADLRLGSTSLAIEARSPGGDLVSKDKIRSPSQVDRASPAGSKEFLPGDLMPVTNHVGIPPSSPCVFLLLTESGAQQAVHTHDYRAYQYQLNAQGGFSFESRTVSVVNIGPAFRVQYDSFSPVSPFPLVPISLKYEDQGREEPDRWSSSSGSRRELREMQESRPLTKEQMLLDMYCEGFTVERLGGLIGPDGMRRVPELEDLYAKMLSKLETLAKQVCECSAALVEQEKLHAKMRAAFMGTE